MPVISMFHGILVKMFFIDNDRHYLPHIHVEYQGATASFAIVAPSAWQASCP